MLCTMCMHGVNVKELWICECPDDHCRHIHECPTCGLKRHTLVEEGNPDGRPANVAAWRKKLDEQTQDARPVSRKAQADREGY